MTYNIFRGLTGTINQSAWDLKEYEPMTFEVYITDSVGNIRARKIVIWKDFIVPKFTIDSPNPNQLCEIEASIINLTIYEPNIQLMQYSINGRPNMTFITDYYNSFKLDFYEWNTAENGTASIIITIIDKAGNWNSSEVIVGKDAIAPDFMIFSTKDDDVFGKTAPEFSIYVYDEDLNTTWYAIQGVKVPFTGINGTIDQALWNNISQ